jgi:ferredoxin
MKLRGLIAEAQAIARLPEVYAERCVHARAEVASCERCLEACPSLAWELYEDQMAIDPQRCDGCGLCAAVCPEGAVYRPHETALGRRGSQLQAFVCCAKANLEATAATLPCVHALGLEQLARWHAQGVRRVVVCTSACSHCPRGAGESLLTRTALLNRVLSQRDAPPLVVETLAGGPWQAAFADALPEDDTPRLSRRGFLSRVFGAAADRASAAGEGRQWRPPGTYLPGPASPRAALYAPSIDPARCNGCDACVRVCPHGALALAQHGDAYLIEADACTGCGLCVDLCDRQAMRVTRAGSPAASRLPLATGRCRSCGAEYHKPAAKGRSEPLCHVCRRVNHRRGLFQVLP